MRPVAIYLPQFHPIPENDAWWQPGFTEWTNVTKAKPLFKNHYQPHLPSDLGFYDLRVCEVREQQAQLAKEHGIHGFCYYHYWFNGQRLLERPFTEVLESGKPDFPFMLFWANETWSRTWLGLKKDILIQQAYSTKDDYHHAEYLVKVFKDKRYITIDGRPVFIIYRPLDLPDVSATIKILRTVCRRENVEPYLVVSNSHLPEIYDQNVLSQFDAILNFRPQLGALPDAFNDKFLWRRLKRNFFKHGVLDGKLKLYHYKEALELMQKFEPPFERTMPSVFVGWDNTPRRNEKGIIVYGNNADLFKEELKRVKTKMVNGKSASDILFINAWNEWAEGNHLEPDLLNNTDFLNAIQEVFKNEKSVKGNRHISAPVSSYS